MGKRRFGLLAAGMLGVYAATASGQVAPLAPPDERFGLDAPVPEGAGSPLTRADTDAWLDGFLPYALARGDVAGAVVVIVKDREVLNQRGFGYADVEARRPVDPETTLFRPGSTSKLLTWTAVMQLVEQQAIDLDADVNRYLDFEIPPHDGRPVTLREILTHTAGFEESIRSLITFDRPIASLGATLQRWIPERIHAPGTTPAYSNYATTLAGYVVERVSGQSFDDYVEANIFGRLGMTHSTFRQPLPENLAPLMSRGYRLGSGEAESFELIAMAPAGSLSSTGADMAKFMIAHLDEGGPLLAPATARQMHAPGPALVPGVNRMALGFYEQWIHGQRAIGHGGDTFWFHSYMWLFPESDVGLFVSMNSAGKDGATGAIRGALFEQFANRYLVSSAGIPEELDTAAEHGRMLAGTYWNSRRADTNFLRVLQLMGQVKISVDAESRPVVPAIRRLGGAPRSWIEVTPFVWQDADGYARLAATVEDGQVNRWTYDDLSPFMVFDRIPWYLNGSWLLPVLVASLGILALTALSWPVAAIARRRYRQKLVLLGRERTAYRLLRAFAWLVVLVTIGWGALVATLMSDFNKHEQLDWLILLLQVSSVIGFFGLLAVASWNLALVWTQPRGWFAKAWSVPVALAAVFCLWAALGFHLFRFGTNF